MIKYLSTNTSRDIVKFDDATLNIDTIEPIYPNIDYIWIVPEDGTFNGEEVKKGDLIMRMFSIRDELNCLEKETIVVKDVKLINYYSKLIENSKKPDNNRPISEVCCNTCCDEAGSINAKG